jgi:hypothetical protein
MYVSVYQFYRRFYLGDLWHQMGKIKTTIFGLFLLAANRIFLGSIIVYGRMRKLLLRILFF